MKNMFVYGSLKKGFFNHYMIEENLKNKLIRDGMINGYNLYLLWSYPGAKVGAFNDKIFVELYSLTDEVFERIDRMERQANYTSVEVEDDRGNVGILYIYNGDVDKENIISFGNWTKDNEKLKIIKTREEDGE